MEGYLVKDLIIVVERALHNSERSRGRRNTLVPKQHLNDSASVDPTTPSKELNIEDFYKALETYQPVALRNIPLYKPEDINFDSVGGLAHMKTILIETIQWPAKVITCRSSNLVLYTCVCVYVHMYVCIYYTIYANFCVICISLKDLQFNFH